MSAEKRFEVIQKIPFFDGVQDEDIKLLSSISSFQKFAPGSKIIDQGGINLTLFFLVAGKVDVFVNDEFVISFHGGGIPFGEMGFVSHELASASVVAKSEVIMLTLRVDDINKLNDPIHYRMKMEFYRSCAEILAKKLMATNDMARSFKIKYGGKE